jgi:hypothetical protein
MSAARETVRASGGPQGVVAARLRAADGAGVCKTLAAVEAAAT